MRRIALITSVLALLITAGCSEEKVIPERGVHIMEENVKEDLDMASLAIIDIYDNVGHDSAFRTGFGFSCIIKHKDRYILFDTGGDSETLLENMKTLGIEPSQVSIIFLSHIHGDHTGGLLGFLEKNSNVDVYAPASFPSSFKEEIKSKGASLTEIQEPAKISENTYSTGELGTSIKEQSMIVDSDKGLIVITGCAHPGIVDILRKAKELHNKKIYLAMGGFHHPPASTAKEFRELGVEKAAPSHCTGEPTINAFREEYKNDFMGGYAGNIIKI